MKLFQTISILIFLSFTFFCKAENNNTAYNTSWGLGYTSSNESSEQFVNFEFQLFETYKSLILGIDGFIGLPVKDKVASSVGGLMPMVGYYVIGDEKSEFNISVQTAIGVGASEVFDKRRFGTFGKLEAIMRYNRFGLSIGTIYLNMSGYYNQGLNFGLKYYL